MGQKVNPHGMRLGIVRDWDSKWYASNQDYANFLEQDFIIRNFLQNKLKNAHVSRIEIKRLAQQIHIVIHTARPGVIIGKKGNEVELLRDEIFKRIKVPVHLSIQEVKKPDLVAKLVADSIAQQLERRVMFRRAMRRAVQSAMRQSAQGIRVEVSGRLGGAEIARREWYREGRVPLHTFRADIDYATASAHTTYGVIGVKVWIYKGDKYGVKDVGKPARKPKESTGEA